MILLMRESKVIKNSCFFGQRPFFTFNSASFVKPHLLICLLALVIISFVIDVVIIVVFLLHLRLLPLLLPLLLLLLFLNLLPVLRIF